MTFSIYRDALVRPSISNIKRLRIEKTREYVWRIDGFSEHAWHNHITAWNVFYGENLVLGGAEYGSNVRSGYARLETRKAALAFAQGFEDQMDGDLEKEPFTEKRQAFKTDPVRFVADSDLNQWYDAGAYEARSGRWTA